MARHSQPIRLLTLPTLSPLKTLAAKVPQVRLILMAVIVMRIRATATLAIRIRSILSIPSRL
jgi:hypothetical protein